MLTPAKIQAISDPIEEVYIHIVDELRVNNVKHLTSQTCTHTAAWEIQKLSEMGQLTQENAEIINKWIKQLPKEVRDAMEETRRLALEKIEKGMEKAVRLGKLPEPLADSTVNVLNEYSQQAIDQLAAASAELDLNQAKLQSMVTEKDKLTAQLQLLEGLKTVEDEKQVENQINQIIAKLQRKKRNLDSTTLEHFASMTCGMTPEQFIADIKQRPAADARNRLLANEELFALLQAHKPNGGKPVVISNEEDELLSHTRGYGKNDQRPEDYLDAFSQYVTTNMNEIAALKIICTRPKDLTRASLKNLKLALDREGFTTQQLNTAISELTNEEMAADIISLIRRYAIGSALISHESRIRRAVDKLTKAHQFS